jgi:hypothetical protein
MSAALTFVIPKGFDRRTYLRGFSDGCKYDRPIYDRPAPGDPAIKIQMVCCGARYRFAADTLPLDGETCGCGSGIAFARWVEEGACTTL